VKLDRLDVYNLRNINNLTLSELGKSNLFYGANGAGKTTLLEAIHLLASGRSFRSTQSRRVIRYEADSCAVVGNVSSPEMSHKIGIQRKRSGGFTIRIDGDNARSASSLARILPVQLLNSESFSLLEQGPKKRRQLLDWGVFHVKPQFHGAWARARQALKQRNSLLKARMPIKKLQLEIEPWDREFASAGYALHQMRSEYFSAFEPIASQLIKDLVGIGEDVQVSLDSGWKGVEESYSEQSIFQALKAGFAREQQRGMTVHGPHRADLSITVNGLDVGHVLSRGQQKMMVCALKLGQTAVFGEKMGRNSILLADDLPAELDEDHQLKLFGALQKLDCQCFLTSVNRESVIESIWGRKEPIALFHVEQGKANRVANNEF